MNTKIGVILEAVMSFLLAGVLVVLVIIAMTVGTPFVSATISPTASSQAQATPVRVTQGIDQPSTPTRVDPQTTQPITRSQQILSVVGHGVATAKPDFARAQVGVETIAPTVAEATSQNTQTMEAVIDTLKEGGIAADDIQTINYWIAAERSYEGGGIGTLVGYRVSNMVEITIRDLQRVGAILEQATQAGANSIYGISFGVNVQTHERAETEARRLAMADLRARAASLAELNGVHIGALRSVSEGTLLNTVSVSSMAGEGAGGAAAIQPGTFEVHIQVQATYEVH